MDRIRNNFQEQFQTFIDYLEANKLIYNSKFSSKFRTGILPLGGPLEKTFSDRILLCGDAAGFVNAFTAEGIYYSMVTGDLAADTAVSALQNKVFNNDFCRRMASVIIYKKY